MVTKIMYTYSHSTAVSTLIQLHLCGLGRGGGGGADGLSSWGFLPFRRNTAHCTHAPRPLGIFLNEPLPGMMLDVGFVGFFSSQ